MTRNRWVLWCTAILVSTMLSACGGKDEPMGTTTSEKPVCGLVDPALAAEVLGSGPLRTTGDGAVPEETRLVTPSGCSIRAADASAPVIQVDIGEVEAPASTWRKRLDQEADEAGVEVGYTDEPGYGYARDYTTGIYNPGSSVNVLRGDRIIRVTIYKWSGSTHEQRVAIAEKIVKDADQNLTAYDEAQG